jgi:hypothetical protein
MGPPSFEPTLFVRSHPSYVNRSMDTALKIEPTGVDFLPSSFLNYLLLSVYFSV